ncbi:GAF domain-containing sensor histidine kinase [Ilumatobacter sp.]|uniref:GAF domain-containing sensor histidine kinase n=1 Tax=Ilumatobacter sp. TaxID=1967498 RepID=UPI003B51B383
MVQAGTDARVEAGPPPPTREFDPASALRAVRDVASAIAKFHSVPEIVGAIAQSLQGLDGGPSVTVGVAEADGPLRLMALEGFDPSTIDRWGTIDRSVPVPLTDVLRTGEIMYFSSRTEMLRPYPHLADEIGRNDHHSWAAVPLLSETGPCGTVGLAWDAPRSFSEVERLFMLTLAKLGGEALRRASRDLDREDLVVLLADASDNDRIEIARDLHDQSVQRLAAASIRLGAVRMDHLAGRDGPLADALEAIESDVQEVIRTLRDIIVDLHPPDMTGLSLAQAIEDFADWLFDAGVDVVIHDDTNLPMTDPVSEMAYRIATEALSNVLRHASASRAVVELAPRGDDLHLSISDDGVGISDSSLTSGTGHLGLRMIRERIAAAGGHFAIDGNDGVTIAVVIPMSSSLG